MYSEPKAWNFRDGGPGLGWSCDYLLPLCISISFTFPLIRQSVSFSLVCLFASLVLVLVLESCLLTDGYPTL